MESKIILVNEIFTVALFFFTNFYLISDLLSIQSHSWFYFSDILLLYLFYYIVKIFNATQSIFCVQCYLHYI